MGFGHVTAGLLVIHPDAFLASVPDDMIEVYKLKSNQRKQQGERLWEEIRVGKSQAFKRAQNRRFNAKDVSEARSEEEVQILFHLTLVSMRKHSNHDIDWNRSCLHPSARHAV